MQRNAAATSLDPSDPQERIGIEQKLEVGFYYGKFEIAKSRVRSQQGKVMTRFGFESHGRINTRFASRNAHDFKNRIAMELSG